MEVDLKSAETKLRRTGPRGLGKRRAVLIALIVAVVLGAVSAAAFLPRPPEPPIDVLSTCIKESDIRYHIHVGLRITISGTAFNFPPQIGMEDSCTRPLHTHDAVPVPQARIHVESAQVRTYYLREFFLVWNEPFSRDRILLYAADATRPIKMFVNGQENDLYENLPLADGQEIEIRYG